MAGNLKILTLGGGTTPPPQLQSVATDVALKAPFAGTDGGHLITANSSGNVDITVSVLKTRLMV